MSKLKFNGKQTVSVLLTSAQLVTGFVVAEVESTPVIEYAYTEDDLNEEVYELLKDYPYSNEEYVRFTVALKHENEMDPMLFGKITGDYKQASIDSEILNKMTRNFHYSTSLNSDIIYKHATGFMPLDELAFITAINIDRCAKDNADLITYAFGEQTIDSAIMGLLNMSALVGDLNTKIYLREDSTANMTRLSNYIYEMRAKLFVQQIEDWVDEAAQNKGNADKQNEMAEKIINYLQTNKNLPVGARFAVREVLDVFVMHISRSKENEVLLTALNESAIINYCKGTTFFGNFRALIAEGIAAKEACESYSR